MTYIDRVLLYIVSIVVVVLSLILYRLYRTNNYIYAQARKWMGHMGTIGGQVRNKQKRERIKLESKGKLVSAIGGEIPFASGVLKRLRDDGVSEDDLFTMMTDPEVMEGVVVLAKAVGKGTEAFKGLFNRGDGEKKGALKKRKERGPERLSYDVR